MNFSPVEAVRAQSWPRQGAAKALSEPVNAVVALILVGSIVRIVMAGVVGLGSDESYTVANARTFALSYVEYPPLHAWLVGAWVQAWGSQAPWLVRLPFIAFFAGSTWLMYRLAGFLSGARAGVWAALLFNLAPVFTLPHASWVLPDGPLIFFMLASACVIARLLFEEPAPSADVPRWLAAGALAGLAMLSKYHGVFLLVGTFVFLLSWKPGRALLGKPGPWLGALAAVALFAPVIVWNANHDWSGFLFQAARLSAHSAALGRVLASLGGQAGYLAPWFFVPLAWLWIRALGRGPARPRDWFLAMLASGPILFFTLSNIAGPGLPHWEMPGWLFVFPLLGAAAARLAQRRPALMRNSAVAAAGVLLIVIALFGAEARTGFLVDAAHAHADPTIDVLDWNGVPSVLAERGLLKSPVIAAVQWKEAGKLDYVMGRAVPVLCLCADPQEFRYKQTPQRFAGQDIILIGAHRPPSEIASAVRGRFARLETLQPIILRRRGRPAVELTVMRGIDFRPGDGG